jgi:hypothetical protein
VERHTLECLPNHDWDKPTHEGHCASSWLTPCWPQEAMSVLRGAVPWAALSPHVAMWLELDALLPSPSQRLTVAWATLTCVGQQTCHLVLKWSGEFTF